MTNFKIDPALIAFDIDGVVADTMTLFLDIARDEYNIDWIRFEDINCYQLEECLNLDAGIIGSIINRIMDGDYTAPLKPIAGAPDVLSRLGRQNGSILFVTARPYLNPIDDWIKSVLTLDPVSVEVIATGSFDAKVDVLVERGITYFVEDRLETCFPIQAAGLVPVLFKQPWNREHHPFMEVSNWKELESLIEFK